MSAPVDADAVWAVLEPLGWVRDGGFSPDELRKVWWFTNRAGDASVSVSSWGGITVEIDGPEDYGALAALSRLLGDTGQAAPEQGEGV